MVSYGGQTPVAISRRRIWPVRHTGGKQGPGEGSGSFTSPRTGWPDQQIGVDWGAGRRPEEGHSGLLTHHGGPQRVLVKGRQAAGWRFGGHDNR